MERIELDLALLNELIEEYAMFGESFQAEKERELYAMGTSVEYLEGKEPDKYREDLAANYESGNGMKLEEHTEKMKTTLDYADTSLTELRQECEKVGTTIGAYGSASFSKPKFMYDDSVKNAIVGYSQQLCNASERLYKSLTEINIAISPIVEEDFSSQIEAGKRQLDQIGDFAHALTRLGENVETEVETIIAQLCGCIDTGTLSKYGKNSRVEDVKKRRGDDDIIISNIGSLSKIQKQNIRIALERLGWKESLLTDEFMNDLFGCMEKYDITSNKQIAHFLSQISVECQNGYSMIEKYNGNSPEEYFANRDFHKYNNLVDSPAATGDGAKYRGAGLIHLTWKTTYNDFAMAMNDPEILNQGYSYVAEKYAIESACWFWATYKNIDDAIEEGKAETVIDVTKKVNGGTNGLNQRTDNYNLIIELFQND